MAALDARPAPAPYCALPLNLENRLNVRRIAAILALFPCVLVHAAALDDDARLRAAVDAAVKPVMRAYDVPGMAVAVTVGGRTRYFNYGLASRESGAKVDEHTLFELGSISKTFTATLALDAAAAGKLKLDAHPSTYLPALKGTAVDRATVLDLGTYTVGGLPLQVPDEIEDDAQARTWLQGWQPDAAPASVRRYSNPSIGLLGRAAARALDMDFTAAVQARIFAPLGLKESFYRVPADAMGRYAWGYNDAGKPVRVNPGVFDMEAYGVKSSAADMIRVVQANIAPSGPLQRALEGSHVGYFQAGGMVQGLGWEQYPYPVTQEMLLAGNAETMIRQANPVTRLVPPRAAALATLFNKTGSTGGFGAYVAFVPAREIGVVILANRNFPIPARVKVGHALLGVLVHG